MDHCLSRRHRRILLAYSSAAILLATFEVSLKMAEARRCVAGIVRSQIGWQILSGVIRKEVEKNSEWGKGGLLSHSLVKLCVEGVRRVSSPKNMPALFDLSRRVSIFTRPLLLDFLAPAVYCQRREHARSSSTAAAAARHPIEAGASLASSRGREEEKKQLRLDRAANNASFADRRRTGKALLRAADVIAHELKQARSPPPTRHRTLPREKNAHSDSPSTSPSLRRRPSNHSTSNRPLTHPVNLLNSIRSTKSDSSSSLPGFAAAHLQLLLGVSGSKRDFDTAFTKGWIPLRNMREVGRLPLDVLVKVLEACSPDATASYWPEVRELVLWLAGERGAGTAIVDWAWKEISRGKAGAQRVVDVWEGVLRAEHLALRTGEEALDGSWATKMFSSDEEQGALRLDCRLYTTYIVARAVLHSFDPNPLPFATLISSLFPTTSHAPKLDKARHKTNILSKTLSSPAYTTLPGVRAKAEAWLRQVQFAQLWHEDAAPGRRFVAAIKVHFRQGDMVQPFQLWERLREAVESEEAWWISKEQWNASAAMRWVDGRDGVSPEEAPSTDMAIDITSDYDGSDSIPRPPPPSSSEVVPFPSQTFLHQSHLAPLILGFTVAHKLDVAGSIWTWIATQDPPLDIGVVTWTALMGGYSSQGNVKAAEDVWNQMKGAGVTPDVWAWIEYATTYFYAKEPDKAMTIVSRMLADENIRGTWEGGVLPDVIYRRIILGLLRNARVAQAEEILKAMRAGGVEIQTATINLFLRHHTTGARPDLPGIISTLRLLAELGLESDIFTFTMILQCLLASKDTDAASKLMRLMDAAGVKPTLTTYGAVINSMAQTGDISQLRSAVGILNEMESRKLATNEIIYTAIILGFLRAAREDKSSSIRDETGLHPHISSALALKRRMEDRKIHLNRIGYNGLIHAALSLGSTEGRGLAVAAFREMQKRRVDLEGAEEDKLGKDGRWVTVADTWYILLDGLGKMEEWGLAKKFLEEMKQSGFVPQSLALKRLVDDVYRGGFYSPRF